MTSLQLFACTSITIGVLAFVIGMWALLRTWYPDQPHTCGSCKGLSTRLDATFHRQLADTAALFDLVMALRGMVGATVNVVEGAHLTTGPACRDWLTTNRENLDRAIKAYLTRHDAKKEA